MRRPARQAGTAVWRAGCCAAASNTVVWHIMQGCHSAFGCCVGPHTATTSFCPCLPAGTATVSTVVETSYTGFNELTIQVTLNIPRNGGSGAQALA